jgi:hypothetical protein
VLILFEVANPFQCAHLIPPDAAFHLMIAGLWVGFRLYGKLNDAAFRKIILVLLLIAGLGLILPRVV